ncbi:MAG: hypothetical protein KJ655_03145 [Candidatus Thermoplasmatota archaeon]|nr:hypothetical protein [Candidatus Thermoplasmatota archaeon]
MVKIKRNNFRTPQLDFLEVFNLRIKFLQSLERAWNDGVEAFAEFIRERSERIYEELPKAIPKYRNYKKDLGGVLIGGLKKRFKRV